MIDLYISTVKAPTDRGSLLGVGAMVCGGVVAWSKRDRGIPGGFGLLQKGPGQETLQSGRGRGINPHRQENIGQH